MIALILFFLTVLVFTYAFWDFSTAFWWKESKKNWGWERSLHPDAQMFAGCVQCFARCARQMLRRWSSWCTCIQLWEAYEISRAPFTMINRAVTLTYFYLLLYIVLSTVVILYNKVCCCSSLIPCWRFRISETPPTRAEMQSCTSIKVLDLSAVSNFYSTVWHC